MKKIIIFFISVFINKIVSPVDINRIRDTYSILSDEFKHCSPIHGAVWIETQLLKKYFKYGNAKDATIVLIKELFHIIEDSFGVTNNLSMPAKHFSPQLIGEIIGTIEKSELTDKKELPKKIQNLIMENPEFKTSNQTANKQLEGDKLKNAIRIMNQRVTKLSKAITSSLEECGYLTESTKKASYPQYITHAILLGLLYRISDDKKSLRSYFETLNATINDGSVPAKSIFTQNGEKVFKATDWNFSFFENGVTNSILLACSGQSDKGNVDQFLSSVKPKLPGQYDPFEAIVFAEIIRQFYSRSLPQIISRNAGGHGKTSFAGTSFADCMEVTIRDLCNIVVFNPETLKFIPEKTGNLNPSHEIMQYYQGIYADATKHTLPNTFQAWGNLMQNIPGVIYAAMSSKSNRNERYERLIHGNEIFVSHLAQPCYALLNKQDIDALPTTNLGNRKNLNVGSEPYIIGDSSQYNAYALWPSLKNVIILLNYLFGLELYKDDPLAPFKDREFCSKYFPKLCEKLGWAYDFPVSQDRHYPIGSLNLEYFRWWARIRMWFIKDSRSSWDLFMKWHHAEVNSLSSSAIVKLPEGYSEKLFGNFIAAEESMRTYSLLALFVPKKNISKYQSEEYLKNLGSVRAQFFRCLFEQGVGVIQNMPAETEGGEQHYETKGGELQEKLKKLKKTLSNLKNKLSLLKAKLNGLSSVLKGN